jgi:hypothetical protein
MIPRALPRIGWSSDLDTYSTPACQIATKQRRNGIASPAIFPKTGTARNNSIEKDNHFIRESTAHTSCLQSMQSRVGGACKNEGDGGIRGCANKKTMVCHFTAHGDGDHASSFSIPLCSFSFSKFFWMVS